MFYRLGWLLFLMFGIQLTIPASPLRPVAKGERIQDARLTDRSVATIVKESLNSFLADKKGARSPVGRHCHLEPDSNDVFLWTIVAEFHASLKKAAIALGLVLDELVEHRLI